MMQSNQSTEVITTTMYKLMNKDTAVMTFAISRTEFGDISFSEISSNKEQLPIGFENIERWVEKRRAPKHRAHIQELLQKCGCDTLEGFLNVSHALSLNDTFWVKKESENLKWEQVSLYKNPFDEIVARLAFEGGMYGEQLSSTSPEYTGSGARAKCWVREDDGIYLYKRGSWEYRNSGKEPYCEAYASQIAPHICKHYTQYELCKYRDKLATKCRLFTSEKYGFLSIDLAAKGIYKIGGLMKFMSEHNAEDDFRRMVVFDSLVLNTDRHRNNYGMMVDNDTLEVLGMAPMFDYDQCLLPYADDADLNMKNREAYLASRPCRIGMDSDFNLLANAMLTPAIRADLINLKGFRFETGKYDFEPKRLRALEEIINKQIDNVLQRKAFYLSAEARKEVIP